MSDLKKQLIKLGSTNPELQPHIREILASLSSGDVMILQDIGASMFNIARNEVTQLSRLPSEQSNAALLKKQLPNLKKFVGLGGKLSWVLTSASADSDEILEALKLTKEYYKYLYSTLESVANRYWDSQALMGTHLQRYLAENKSRLANAIKKCETLYRQKLQDERHF